jgi:DNA repair protein SbcC/Rad50
MIKSIELTHFQSHKNTTLELHPGVNSIIGESNSGKTAILRGLYWAIYNRPSGIAFVSHWNRDKNDEPKEDTIVSITLENTKIDRVRSKKFNGYRLPNVTLEAIKVDVPEEVVQAFNISEVNIQKQMDMPFLISESPGEVARFFNRIIRLDLIDRVLSAAESRKRKIKQDTTRATESEKELSLQLDTMGWTDKAESLLGKAQKVSDRIDNNIDITNSFSIILESARGIDLTLGGLSFLPEAIKAADIIDHQLVSIKSVESQALQLQSLVQDFRAQKEIIKNTPDLSGAESLLDKIKNIQQSIKDKAGESARFTGLIQDFQHDREEVGTHTALLEKYQALLPKICPLCGNPLEEKKCTENA